MDANVIITTIQAVGFPIAACIALYMHMVHQDTDHKEEVNQLKDAINNNTLVMQSLVDELRRDAR